MFLTVFMAASAMPVAAQWLNYPTRTSADSERQPQPLRSSTANGRCKPDLPGVWETDRKAPCPLGGCDDTQTVREFLDIGATLEGGLPYRPGMAELQRFVGVHQRLTSPSRDVCL
jgi:hypothetical protein